MVTREDLEIYFTIPSMDTINNNAGVKSRLVYTLFSQSMTAAKESYYYYRENFFDEILPHFYIGKLPTPDAVLPKNIDTIFSMSTYEELETALTPAELQQRGIRQIFLHIPDHTAQVSVPIAIEALREIHTCLMAQPPRPVFLHCKLGHSRSVMEGLAYLMLHGEEKLRNNASEAFSFLRTKRPCASLEEDKIEKAKAIVAQYDQSIKDFPNSSTPAAYLGTIAAKNAIRQLMSFKEIMVQATRERKSGAEALVICLQGFLNKILQAMNDEWYQDFKETDSGLSQELIKLKLPAAKLEKWAGLLRDFAGEMAALLLTACPVEGETEELAGLRRVVM